MILFRVVLVQAVVGVAWATGPASENSVSLLQTRAEMVGDNEDTNTYSVGELVEVLNLTDIDGTRKCLFIRWWDSKQTYTTDCEWKQGWVTSVNPLKIKDSKKGEGESYSDVRKGCRADPDFVSSLDEGWKKRKADKLCRQGCDFDRQCNTHCATKCSPTCGCNQEPLAAGPPGFEIGGFNTTCDPYGKEKWVWAGNGLTMQECAEQGRGNYNYMAYNRMRYGNNCRLYLECPDLIANTKVDDYWPDNWDSTNWDDITGLEGGWAVYVATEMVPTPSPTPKPTRVPTPKPTPVPTMPCTWTAQQDQSSMKYVKWPKFGYVPDSMPLEDAKQWCLKIGSACKAVTCPGSGGVSQEEKCSPRGASLTAGPSGEVSFVPTAACYSSLYYDKDQSDFVDFYGDTYYGKCEATWDQSDICYNGPRKRGKIKSKNCKKSKCKGCPECVNKPGPSTCSSRCRKGGRRRRPLKEKACKQDYCQGCAECR